MSTRKLVLLLAVFAATLVLWGCSSSPETAAVVEAGEEVDTVAAETGSEEVEVESAAAEEESTDGQWCSDMTIRFFSGGAEGDAFGSIVQRGAQAAAADLGPQVDYIFSGWDTETMTNQLRDAIAASPDGIAMMGHPGNDALLPLAEEAAAAGILMMYQNVPVHDVTAQLGGGYVGAEQFDQGYALGQEALRTLDLSSGDQVIVVGAFETEERGARERGVVQAFEEGGLEVIQITVQEEWSTDPSLMIPALTSAVLSNPDVKLISHAGGQLLGAAEIYNEALDKGPGEIYHIGFDTSAAIIDGFRKGYIQLTADQQPFLQGYLPILSLCLTEKYGFAPLNVETGAGFVDVNNFEAVAAFAEQGIR
ncbi:MAG: substrate-binding domain-containing protein [Anaerolineaceae bacterium]|nr:substrate-binding domain-containing protein [Anaerolineaceae bacterium]